MFTNGTSTSLAIWLVVAVTNPNRKKEELNIMRQHCDDTIQDQAHIAGTQAADETAIEQAAHVKDDHGATTALIDA